MEIVMEMVLWMVMEMVLRMVMEMVLGVEMEIVYCDGDDVGDGDGLVMGLLMVNM